MVGEGGGGRGVVPQVQSMKLWGCAAATVILSSSG